MLRAVEICSSAHYLTLPDIRSIRLTMIMVIESTAGGSSYNQRGTLHDNTDKPARCRRWLRRGTERVARSRLTPSLRAIVHPENVALRRHILMQACVWFYCRNRPSFFRHELLLISRARDRIIRDDGLLLLAAFRAPEACMA